MLIGKRTIPSTLEEVKNAISWFEKIISKLEMNENIVIVFNEMILNAYEHGNLGISKKQKEELLKNNTYEKTLHELEKKSDKKIYIEIHKYHNYLITIIKDEGNGFDFDKTKKIKTCLCGRGILISKKIADIFYNEKGNKVCFIKKIKE